LWTLLTSGEITIRKVDGRRALVDHLPIFGSGALSNRFGK
jgi:hypothetical protein